jgi:4-hydroxybenzoate polyprenyltransferase
MGLARNYIRMMRVEDWIFGYFFIPIIGSIAAIGLSESLVWTAFVSFCVIAFGFVINNYADVEIDRCHSQKQKTAKNPLAANIVSVNGTRVLMTLLVGLPLVICLILSLPAFFFTVCTLVLLLAYSLQPLRLKERYIADIVTHGLMFGTFPFLIGYTLLTPGIALLEVRPLALCILFTIIGFLALIVHQIYDYAEDVGCSPTTIVRIGMRHGWRIFAVFFSMALISLGVVCVLLNLPSFMLYGSLTLFIIPIYTLKDRMRTDYNAGVTQAR